MADARSLRNLTPDDIVQSALRAFAAAQRNGKLPYVGGFDGKAMLRTYDATFEESIFVSTMVEELERRLGNLS